MTLLWRSWSTTKAMRSRGRCSSGVGLFVAMLPAMVGASSGIRATPQVAPTGAGIAEYRDVLSTYCFGCHNERTRAGGLALDQADLRDVAANAVVWEKVVRKLEARTMPPVNAPRPEPAISAALRQRLET